MALKYFRSSLIFINCFEGAPSVPFMLKCKAIFKWRLKTFHQLREDFVVQMFKAPTITPDLLSISLRALLKAKNYA